MLFHFACFVYNHISFIAWFLFFAFFACLPVCSLACSLTCLHDLTGPIVPPPPHLESTFDPIPGLDPYPENPYPSLRSHHSTSSLGSVRSSASRRYNELGARHVSPADIPYSTMPERRPPRHSTGSMPPPPPSDMPTSFVDDVIERPLNEPPPGQPPHHRHITPPEYAQVYPRGRRPRQSMSSEESTSPLSKDDEG